MSEIYESNESNETTNKQNDVIIIKLEEIKEPLPINLKKTDDDKIELKPENVLIDGIEHLYSYMKHVHREKITPMNIVIIATELMQIVEKYKELTGPQKKMLIINVIKKIVNNQIDSQETRTALNTIIDFTLPIVIDNLVSAINGEIKFNKEKVESFFKKYICCCFNKK
jgi:hypothetical protein